MKEIAAALVKAQKNFAPALKTSVNHHFRSKYVDLAACVEAVIDALNGAGIALMQRCHECDNGVIVETVFIHESGEMLDAGKLHVPANKADAQGYGSALTYARRYSIMAACGIAPEDDDGNAASSPKSEKKPQGGLSEKFIVDHESAIESANDKESLIAAWNAAKKSAQEANDEAAESMFRKATNKRKEELGISK